MTEDLNLAYYGLIEAINSGRIGEERIKQSLERVLKVKIMINWTFWDWFIKIYSTNYIIMIC